MKKSLFIFFCLLLSGLYLLSPEIARRRRSWVVSVSRAEYFRFLSEGRAPLDRLYRRGDEVALVVNRLQMNALDQAGIAVDILCWDEYYGSRETRLTAADVHSGGINGIYHSYQETQELLQELCTRYPELTSLVTLGQSVEGREIWALKISDQADREENEPNVYVTGCHHAREWISVEMPLEFARHLLDRYHEQARIRQLVDQAQLYIIPILNPDGLEFSIHTYRMWRKNRRYLGDLVWGVDLNRNYSYAWGYDDAGSSPDPASEAYRGPVPFSEPEILILRDYLYQHPPSGMLNFHNYSQLILIPWGFTAEPPADYPEMFAMAAEMSDRIRAVNGRHYEFGSGATAIYPTNGDSDDWVYGTFGVPSFTIELPPLEFENGHFFTSEDEIQKTSAEILPALMYFCEYVKDHFSPALQAPGDRRDLERDRKPGKINHDFLP